MGVNTNFYKRKLTNADYRLSVNGPHKSPPAGLLDKIITENVIIVRSEEVKENGYFEYLDMAYGVQSVQSVRELMYYGTTAVAFFVWLLYIDISHYLKTGHYDFFSIIINTILLCCIVFCATYCYKMPEKEFIWNRMDGLITFPGALWNDNITMPIEVVRFAYSSPSSHGTGAYQLLISRPGKWTGYYNCSIGYSCYEDLSFLLWYMDKNRPLPPGTAFDPYRQKDFERRKSEGFPQPIFPARFDTPEATPEQQAERKQIGGW